MITDLKVVVSVFALSGTYVLPGVAWSVYVKESQQGNTWVPTTELSNAVHFTNYEDARAMCGFLSQQYPYLGFSATSTLPYDYNR